MRATSLEIKEQKIKKRLFGYDKGEVEILRELACEALEDAAKEVGDLRGELARMETRLAEHERTEKTLKGTITTAHKMYEDLKGSADKEAKLIVAEARLQAEWIVKGASERVDEIRAEIVGLKRQRKELEASIKAVLDYHSNILELGEEVASEADEEFEKLRFLEK